MRFSINGADQIANCETIRLQHIQDIRAGTITVAEAGGPIPFEFKRVYYISGLNNPETVRGGHAHKSLQQAIFCAAGAFRLDLDDGKHQAGVWLDKREVGVYVGPHVWHTLTAFEPGTVVLVFASDVYVEDDYIREYESFLETVRG